MKKNSAVNNFLLLLFLIIISGCGVKGNPVPYPVVAQNKPTVSKMEAISSVEAIALRWNFQDKDRLVSFIGVERGELGTAGNECKNCPRTYERIGQIMIRGAIAADKEQVTLNFVDEKVVKGRTYNYRLVLCDENGNCPEASEVEINYR